MVVDVVIPIAATVDYFLYYIFENTCELWRFGKWISKFADIIFGTAWMVFASSWVCSYGISMKGNERDSVNIFWIQIPLRLSAVKFGVKAFDFWNDQTQSLSSCDFWNWGAPGGLVPKTQSDGGIVSG